MTDMQTQTTAAESPRLTEFQEEVGRLKVTGGSANPERLGSAWGIGLTIVGFIVLVVSYITAREATRIENVHRAGIAALIGFAIVVTGVVMWIRNSMTRYLRYWIVRLIYEQREQTDALIKALRDK